MSDQVVFRVSLTLRDRQTELVNLGTLRLRLRNASVARSSNIPLSAYSMRIRCGVSTVNRAFPDTTTARGVSKASFHQSNLDFIIIIICPNPVATNEN